MTLSELSMIDNYDVLCCGACMACSIALALAQHDCCGYCCEEMGHVLGLSPRPIEPLSPGVYMPETPKNK